MSVQDETTNKICGIVMPISTIDECTDVHWSEVRRILERAIEEAGLKPRLVSEAPDSGLIHKRIVENLYNDPLAVVDVSAKNPNVMFELGLRLAFDKPTIIVKDDRTAYSFDTGVIEHIPYQRDLRYESVLSFTEQLTTKIKATYAKSHDPAYSTFLGHLGPFAVARIEEREVPLNQLVVQRLDGLQSAVDRLATLFDTTRPSFDSGIGAYGGSALLERLLAQSTSPKNAPIRRSRAIEPSENSTRDI